MCELNSPVKAEKMVCELPEPRKVCYCLSLRKGLICLVYVNLVLLTGASFAFIFTDHIKWFGAAWNRSRPMEYVNMIAIITVLVGDFCEIIMTVIGLVGLHMKKIKYVRAYYYYSIIYTIFVAVSRILNMFNLIFLIFEIPAFIPFLVFKFYYILVLRSQVKKMDQQEQEETELSKARSTEYESSNKTENLI